MGPKVRRTRRLEAEHVAGLAHRSLASLVILALTAACDNVEWGGTEFSLEPPPPARVGAEPADSLLVGPDSVEVPLPPLPEGAVLFAGTRSGATLTLLPLFELRGDTISPLTAEADAPGFNTHLERVMLAPGTEFTLFADGVRVGTLVAESTAASPGWCDQRPTVSGTPELIPAAAGATRFLALARDRAPRTPHADGAFPAATDAYRAGSLLLAQRAIMSESALWPDDLGQARADLAVSPLAPGADPALMATFMFRDRLAVEDPATPVAYSLFVLGERRDNRFFLDYTWYRRVGDDGKGAPRFFQQFDWDGDGSPEILLEVMGTTARWPAVLEQDGDEWTISYEAACDPGAGEAGG